MWRYESLAVLTPGITAGAGTFIDPAIYLNKLEEQGNVLRRGDLETASAPEDGLEEPGVRLIILHDENRDTISSAIPPPARGDACAPSEKVAEVYHRPARTAESGERAPARMQLAELRLHPGSWRVTGAPEASSTLAGGRVVL